MVYLLHFERRVSNAQHYLGFTNDERLEQRLTEHVSGRGAKLVKRVLEQGVAIYLARVFPQLNANDERRLKTASHFDKLCPICCPLFAELRHDVRLLKDAQPHDLPRRAIWDARPPFVPLDFPAIEKGGPT
jgi:predicted GIY-YIG superfamily endonuclease